MSRSRNPQATRANLLAHAAQALTEHGPSFSLDSVAAGAGVSKGGLLHHFPTREALLLALVGDLNGRFTGRVEAAYAQQTEAQRGQPGAWLRAYIGVTFNENPQEITLMLALAPALNSLTLFTEIEDQQGYFVRRAEADGLPAGVAQAVRLACEGYWMGQLQAGTRLNAEQAAALQQQLERWTQAE